MLATELMILQLEYASKIGGINPELYTEEETDKLIEYPCHNIGQMIESLFVDGGGKGPRGKGGAD